MTSQMELLVNITSRIAKVITPRNKIKGAALHILDVVLIVNT